MIKPSNDFEWAHYRCLANCQIAREAMDGKTDCIPHGVPVDIFAAYCQSRALEEIADMLLQLHDMIKKKKKNEE